MVNFIACNKKPLDNKEALRLIKNFFKTELTYYELIDEYDSENSYNGFRIKYVKQEDSITISNSWRGMEHEIVINGKAFSLLNYEPKMKEVLSCSYTNLNFTLAVLKKFIGEQNLQNEGV